MKKEDTSIGAFFKSLFGKNEMDVRADAVDDSDAEYYSLGNRTTQKVEPAAAADDVADEPAEPVKRPEYTPPKTAVADDDDFDFVDDGDIGADMDGGDNDADDADGDDETDEVIDAKVKYIKDAALADATEIADAIIDGAFTVVDIANTPIEEKTRMFDFISGVVYACGGRVEKLQGGKCVLVLPEGMDMDDFKAAMAAMEDDM